MIKTLRESKAKLSHLVEVANRGEDVLITVRGKIKARLTRATDSGRLPDHAAWARRLRKLQKAYSVARPKTSVEEILSAIREDRI